MEKIDTTGARDARSIGLFGLYGKLSCVQVTVMFTSFIIFINASGRFGALPTLFTLVCVNLLTLAFLKFYFNTRQPHFAADWMESFFEGPELKMGKYIQKSPPEEIDAVL